MRESPIIRLRTAVHDLRGGGREGDLSLDRALRLPANTVNYSLVGERGRARRVPPNER